MTLEVRKVPVFDTGLGREAGYKDDAELVAAGNAMEAEVLAMLSPAGRDTVKRAQAQFERKVLGGP